MEDCSLSSASWRHMKASGAILVQIHKPEDQESWWDKPQPGNRRLMPLLSTQADSKFSYSLSFCSIQALNWLDAVHSYCYWEGYSDTPRTILVSNTLADTPRTITKYLGIPWPCEDDTLKLTTMYDLLHFCQLHRELMLNKTFELILSFKDRKTQVPREVRDLTQKFDSELEVNPDGLCHFLSYPLLDDNCSYYPFLVCLTCLTG